MAGVLTGTLIGAVLIALWPRPDTEARPVVQRAPHEVTASVPPSAGDAVSSRTVAPGARALRAPRSPPAALEILTSRYDWPREPVAPHSVDAPRFAQALGQLCDAAADSHVRSWYAEWIVTYARELDVDPFLLAGLIAARSRCGQTTPRDGVGPTGLLPELYAGDVRDRSYAYQALVEGRWVPRTLALPRFPFEARFLAAPESNLYFAAAFLKAWQDRQRGLFASLPQADYRHYVSHFVWGDRVRSNREEDRILIERRRLLEYYGARAAAGPVTYRGLALGCPLDGCPRVITSTLGDSRAGGSRAHRGVDFESHAGEPVRAIAAGRVLFSGADLPGAAHRGVPIHAQRSISASLFGAGGIYVCIAHGEPASARLISCAMHLSSSLVEQGRLVRRGELIGRVGKTGIKESAPHLHFELHADGKVLAASDVLHGLVLGKPRNTPLPHVVERTPAKRAKSVGRER